MGQKIGKANLVQAAVPFSNLPRRAILNLWQVFNNVADGFGISLEELQEICVDLKDELNISRFMMSEYISSIFKTFDTDANGLIDALEFFSTVSVLSGMKKLAIMEFVLTVYDFDGTESLSMDEVVLALKSVAAGLCKVQVPTVMEPRERIVTAKEELIEQLVSTVFSIQLQTNEVDDSIRLNIKTLSSLLTAHPDVSHWFSYFSCPPMVGVPIQKLTEKDRDFEHENPTVMRTAAQLQAIEWNVRCEEVTMAYEGTEHPWVSSVAMLTPLEHAGSELKKEAPNSSITPEWVYGYQAERCKSNLHYNFRGDVVYSVSKFVVVYSIKLHEQNIFTGHSEEVLCLSMHPGLQVAASGEAGPRPKLLVWHTDTHKILYCAQGFHTNGVVQSRFSPDGKLLVSMGNDAQHSVSVCLWEEGQVLFSSPVHAGACLSCAILSGDTVVVGGDTYLCFWSRFSEGYVRRAANFSRLTSMQPVTALVAVHESDNLISGSACGQLLLWVDVNCVRTVKAHDGTANTLFSSAHGVLSGGVDMKVRMWTPNLEPGFTFDISHYGINPCVRSLCMAADGTSILIGTKGSNIYEISAIDGSDLRGGPVALGHCRGVLHNVTTHPSKFEFLTVGEDNTLRVFDMNTNSQLKIVTFDGETKSVAYNPLGDLIVVGFCGDPAQSAKVGAFVVLNEEDLSVVHEAKDSNSAVTVVAFSPEGETLAVGTAEGSIFLYAVHDDYELVGKCDRHRAPICGIDFSVDGEWLRSNSVDRQLFFFNSDDASFQSNVSSMRDVQWASFSCIYSWHVKSMHRSPYVEDQVLCNHTPNFAAEGVLEQYMACGTSLGYVRLYAFPCVEEGAECHRLPAHSGEIAGLRFSFDGQRLITVGLQDRCIVQWKCDTYQTEPPAPAKTEDGAEVAKPAAAAASAPVLGGEDADLLLEAVAGGSLQEEFMPPLSQRSAAMLNSLEGEEDAPIEAVPENDAWLTSVVEPTMPPAVKTALPELSLLLEHVYGYEAQTMRNNLRYCAAGEIVYTVATMGVVLNTANKSQRIYKFHSDTITSFACSSDGALVATGQMGYSPRLAVWDTRSCTTQFVTPEAQLNAVACAAFSQNGEYLAVVGMDEHHTISVYDWKVNAVVSKAYGGHKRLLGVCFLEREGKQELISYGIRELRFWKDITTRFPRPTRAILGEIGVLQNFLCCDVFQNRSVVGTGDGNIYVFNEHNLRHAIKAHNGAVYAMHASSAGNMLATGGRDGAVRLWSADYSCLKEFVLDSLIQPQSSNPCVRSVAFNPRGTHLVVGTRASEVVELAVADGKLTGGGKSLVAGHGMRELRGLSSHPTKEECATAGDDATIRIWDTRNYAQLRCVKMDTSSRAICYSPDGKLIALGFGSGKRTKGKLAPKEGAFVVLRASDLKLMHEGKDSNCAITVVKFSADMKTFVTGSEDNNIYIYNVKDAYSRRSTLRCHQAPVAFIDFSSEGDFIVSVDVSKHVCFSETASGVTIPTPEALRDQRWLTTSSPVSWSVKGFWESQAPGVQPCVAQKSWGGLLVAAGNTGGGIHIAHNPYPRRAGFLTSAAHAGPVSCLAWVAGDGALMSIGRKDHALLQWKVVYDGSRESGDEGGRSCEDSVLEIDGGQELAAAARARSSMAGKKLYSEESKQQGSGAEVEGSTDQWYSMISAPSNPLPDDTSAPDAVVDLDFAHGARLGDCRRTLRYNEDMNVIYVSSCLGIIFDRQYVRQLYYMGHRHPIISLDVDQVGRMAVTGESAELPEIHVWDAKTGAPLVKFEHVHRGGVSSVSFSASAEYLVSLGQDLQHGIAVFHSPSRRWRDGHYICSTSVSASKMLWCAFTASSASFPIVVGGAAGNVYFYRVVRGATERVKGVYGKRHKIQPLLCATEGTVCLPHNAYTNSSHSDPTGDPNAAVGSGTKTNQQVMLCGTVTGYIYLLSECKVVHKVSGHDAPINAICNANKNFLTAGKDGRVKLWSPELKLLHTFNMLTFFPRPYHSSCHNISCTKAGTSMVVGMRGGEVFEVSLQSHSYGLLLESHSRGEVHGMDMNPRNPDECVTAGDDGMVMVWSLSRKYCLRKARVEAPSRALAWSPNGEQIVVGVGAGEVGGMAAKDGAFMVLDAATLEIVREERKAKQYITDIKFAPQQDRVALASSDGRVYVHGCKKFELQRVIETPSKNCAVTAIDFSSDGGTLRMGTSFDQLYYYTVSGGEFVTNVSVIRDSEWALSTCPFTWETQGVFRKRADGVQVRAVAVHHQQRLLCASYLNGDVRLFRYPCQLEHAAAFRVIPGVSTVSTRVRFSPDGRFLVLLDSKTRCLLQFRIKLPPNPHGNDVGSNDNSDVPVLL